MKYIEINIETSETGIELIVARLLALGIDNTEVTDPHDIQEIMEQKETYAWDYIDDSVVEKMQEAPVVTVYLEEGSAGLEKAKEIRADMADMVVAAATGAYGPGTDGKGVDLGSMKILVNDRDDSQWKDKWKEYFKPFRVSEHIVIKPTWEEYTGEPADHILEIDPGMAFGTGTHETTSMCIEMIEKYLKPGDKVLDAGCGSGILTIAAILLGAGQALGVDIDREAVRVANENIVKNHVEDHATARFGDVTEGVDFRGDLVVANLMAELVCMISPDVPAHLVDGGIYISSGILTEKEDMVKAALKGAGFEIVEIDRKGEWCCIVARKGK
ncbi:50S ribosomal protein L11 methyltransferase [Aminicella lysinilytica]|uniref:Ribosomal protein L11 methyltransferase n=1 Tax=Aminicella lysinilytica TaxID=433323 RepID=A0A4R6Q1E0_9FIRM|nr:50S ribosomal protein L11 methyltransferase [Aminicella lysinilytica]TDP54580.1 [LSU ribosomal protein L11P]-lysine N-methyltransferase [Aminicella lysinilytica]